MRRVLSISTTVCFLFIFTGCGSGVQPVGTILQNGEPFVPSEGQFVQISFVRANDEGGSYLAGFNPEDSTFCPGDGRSIPPGKYKVSVQIMKKHKDLLKGKFSPAKTPFVFEIHTGNEEIKIDLGKIPDPPPTRKTRT